MYVIKILKPDYKIEGWFIEEFDPGKLEQYTQS